MSPYSKYPGGHSEAKRQSELAPKARPHWHRGQSTPALAATRQRRRGRAKAVEARMQATYPGHHRGWQCAPATRRQWRRGKTGVTEVGKKLRHRDVGGAEGQIFQRGQFGGTQAPRSIRRGWASPGWKAIGSTVLEGTCCNGSCMRRAASTSETFCRRHEMKAFR